MGVEKYISKINLLIKKHRLFIFWFSLVLIFLFLFLSFIYPDLLITTKHSLNLIQTIINGKPMEFYKINNNLIIDSMLTSPTKVTYDMPIFFIFAIWNLPLWIAQNVFHISVTESFLCIIWMKLMLVALLGLCALIVKKMCIEIKISKKYINLVLFTFISSPLLLMPLLIMGQYDIIPLFFILLGIWMYIRGNFKWFVFWFAIAIPLKLFGLFIFVPLLVLKNKKILQILKNITICLIPLLLTKVICHMMPLYAESTNIFQNDMINKMMSSGIDVNLGKASMFFIGYIAIVIYCYLKELKNKDEVNRFSIYVPLLTLSCFFALIDFHPQWLILITPFIAITIFQNMKNFRINMLLDIASSGAILIVTIFYHYWVYGSAIIDRMILPRIFGSTYGMKMAFQNPSELLTKFNLDKLYPLFLAIYVTCTVAVLIINYPKGTKEVDEKQKIEWGLLFTRMLVIMPVPILMIFCYYYK